MSLSKQKKLFCEEYIITQNKYEAMVASTYKFRTYKEAIVKANSILWEKEVQDYLDQLHKEASIDDKAILRRIESLAMYTLADIIDPKTNRVSFECIKERGLLHLIKNFSVDFDGNESFSLHDQSKFLDKLIQIRGLDILIEPEIEKQSAIGFITDDLYNALYTEE